jgi:hypothetical protein
MTLERRLRIVLVIVGIVFVVGVYPLINLRPSGFRWLPNQHEYEQMIAAIYGVLGVFLIRASRDPLNHLSLIWFTVWSSLVHAAIMAIHAIADPGERVHLMGDVPVLLAVASALAVLTPRRVEPSTPTPRPPAGR